MNKIKCKLSIITVCLNSEKTIAKTIESILNQDYTEYEYLVIDGGSVDKTCSIINGYARYFKEKNISFRHYSEKDNGIYDAMNKGVEKSVGEWITFLNSDDVYCSNAVLSKVFNSIVNEYDYVYGGSINMLGKNMYYRPAKEPGTAYYRMPFVHQSVFVRADLMKKYLFDTSYLYAADFKQFVEIWLEGKKIKKLDFPVVKYDMSGVSHSHILAVMKEHEKIRIINNIFFNRLVYRYVRYIGSLLIHSVRPLFLFYCGLKNKIKI